MREGRNLICFVFFVPPSSFFFFLFGFPLLISSRLHFATRSSSGSRRGGSEDRFFFSRRRLLLLLVHSPAPGVGERGHGGAEGERGSEFGRESSVLGVSGQTEQRGVPRLPSPGLLPLMRAAAQGVPHMHEEDNEEAARSVQSVERSSASSRPRLCLLRCLFLAPPRRFFFPFFSLRRRLRLRSPPSSLPLRFSRPLLSLSCMPFAAARSHFSSSSIRSLQLHTAASKPKLVFNSAFIHSEFEQISRIIE